QTGRTQTINNANAGDAGLYTVTVSLNGCDNTSSTTVVVNAPPNAAATNNGPVCTGGTINLSTPTVTGASYAWTGPGGYNQTGRTQTINNANAGDAGLYTVTVSLNGCDNTSSTTVVVNAPPNAAATNNGPVCTGGTINLSTPTVTGATYAWTGPGGYNQTGRTQTINNANAGDAGLYTVTVSLNGCDNASSTTVVVNAPPNAAATNNGPVCTGGTI